MQQSEFVETMRERTDLDSNEGAETVTVATLHALGTRISEGGLENVRGQLSDELVPDEAEATTSALVIRAPTSSEKPSTGPEDAFIGGGR